MRFRTGRTGGVRGRRAVAAGLVIVIAGLGTACDSSPTDTQDQSTTAAASEADLSIVFGDLSEGLGLTGDQIEAVRATLEEYRGQGRQSGALWYAAADLQEILTSEQIEALRLRQAESQAETRARRGRMGGRDSGAGLEGLHDALDLSDEQIAEMERIRESFAPQIGEIRDGVRSGSLTREEARARMEEIREAMHEALGGILTEEQMSVLDEHRAEAEARRGEAETGREERRGEWEERQRATRAAMVDALGLTADQVAAFDALDTEVRRGERRQAVLDILDDEQEEIWVLHDVLSQLFARHHAPAQGSDGSGRDGRPGKGGRGGFGGTPDRA